MAAPASQTVRALLALRDLILSGTLPPGERLSELALVERLGASRTPVRLALVRLEEEGLVEPVGAAGYAVRAFSTRDMLEAIEIRGTLEGLAARFAAERRPSPAELAPITSIVQALDRVVADRDFDGYVALNEQFHQHLAALAGSTVLTRSLDRVLSLPFASPNAFVSRQAEQPDAWAILVIAQEHHRALVEAIGAGEGSRAEALAREHARIARRILRAALETPAAPLPAAARLHRRAAGE